MALWGPIYVNNTMIGSWSAVRISPHGQPKADDICAYECSVTQAAAPDGCEGWTQAFTLEHRFGDGAIRLLDRVTQKGVALQKGWVKA